MYRQPNLVSERGRNGTLPIFNLCQNAPVSSSPTRKPLQALHRLPHSPQAPVRQPENPGSRNRPQQCHLQSPKLAPVWQLPFSGDDEPDPEAELTTIAQATPGGYGLTLDAPAVDQTLKRRLILFKWRVAGWCLGEVTRVYRRAHPEGYTAEVTYDGGDAYDHKLTADKYSSQEDAPAGSWLLLAKQ